MIDRIPFVAKVALPIDPGSNATSKTESPRNVWTGGYFHAATDQLPCFAGLLFMQYTRNEEFVIRLVKRGDFEIDSEGRIWRVAQKIQYGGMKPVAKRRAERDRAGYLAVGGFIDGKRRDAAAHRLVWKHFYGEIPREMVINHKNGNKQDNRPSNLEVVTTAENNIHAFRVLHIVRPDGKTAFFRYMQTTEEEAVLIAWAYQEGYKHGAQEREQRIKDVLGIEAT